MTKRSKNFRLLVCGGRDYHDWETARDTLERFCLERGLHTDDEYRMPLGIAVISGKARGADTLGVDWAVINFLPFEEYPADWDTHGKAAGPIRNKQMLDTGIDAVIAFPGGRGTAHMVSIARKAGVEVIEVPGEAVTFPKTDKAEGNNFID